MKIFEIRELPEEELAKRIRDEEENLVNLKFQKATSQLESPIRIRLVRRDIAKMKTVFHERQMKKEREAAAVQKTASLQK
ncbi:MAG: 50S ribosomal protein L29 [Ignavibacteriae bacterium]|nr:50S ribosomal protein L29 [Ignavibacteria bacterium]MBI3364478.1 50S ribosomal protein L29 [Ignavibacteriota bacterium]